MAGTKPVLVGPMRGLRNDVPSDDMAVADKKLGTDLTVAANVDINDAGSAARRSGFSRLQAATGLHSLFTNRDRSVSLIVSGTTLCSVAANGATLTQIASGLTAGAPMSYAEYLGRIYHCNGHQRGVYEAGAVRSWGLRRHATPALAPTGGALAPGRYAVACTYMTADGQQSGSDAGVEVNLPDGGGISVAMVEATDPRVTRIRVWCTAADGAMLYLAGDAPNASGNFLIADAVPHTRPLTTLHYDRAPIGHLCAVYRARAYVAVGTRLHYSSPFGLELFREVDFHDLGARISMIAPTLDGIFAGTPEGVWWLGGDRPEAMSALRVDGAAPVEGTLQFAPVKRVVGGEGEFDIPVWLSADGPTIGLPGGALRTINKRYRPEVAGRGAGLVREAGETFQYIASFGEQP